MSGGRRPSQLSIALGVGAMIAGPSLLWALLRWAHLAPRDLWVLAEHIRPGWAALVLVATGGQLVIAGVKWRLVEAHLVARPAPLMRAIAYSMVGAGVSQLLPTPLATALVRGGGNHLSVGGGAWRGALTSVWEQLFDLGVLVMLLPASIAAIAWNRPSMFLPIALVSLLSTDLAIGPALSRIGKLMRIEPRVLAPALSRALFRLSAGRLALMAVVAWSGVQAADLAIRPLQLAPTVAPVALANILSFLPAGLGVSEWGYVVLLHALGAPTDAATAFSLVNRGLVSIASFLLAALGSAVLVAFSRSASRGDQP